MTKKCNYSSDSVQKKFKHDESNSVHLTTEAVLSAASQATGLTDFSPDDFRDRLGYWLRTVNEDTNRTTRSRFRFFRICVNFAIIRLRLNELIRQYPTITETRLLSPVLIVGPTRTGSTHLQGLLATDLQLRAIRKWELYDPISRVESRGVHTSPGPNGYPNVAIDTFKHMPEQSLMHQSKLTDVGEEWYLQGADFANGLSSIFQSLYRVNVDIDNVPDQTVHYQYMKKILQAMQWPHGSSRLILKGAHHCRNIGPLVNTFPDATFVMTHRDPLAVICSAATMAENTFRLKYREMEIRDVMPLIVARLKTTLHKLIRDRQLIPSEQVVDIMFHEFMIDEKESIRRIYNAAGLALSDAQCRRLDVFSSKERREKRSLSKREMNSKFGIEVDKIRSEFQFYYERFPAEYELELP